MANRTSKVLSTQNAGLFQDLVMQIKLIWRLMSDRRVNFILKLLPLTALIYLVSPIDLLPGLALPVIGALDDAAVLWLGFSLFVSLCPENVVQEHMNTLQNVIPGTWREAPEENEIIRVETEEPPKGNG